MDNKNNSMKKFVSLATLLFFGIVAYAQSNYCIEQGRKISVVITQEINSQKDFGTHLAEIVGDVYDESGEVVLIKKGTPVYIQVRCRRANVTGNVGEITITPISTLAYNDREITFDAEPIVFTGNENAVFRSQMKAVVAKGTAFIAPIANTYCFNLQPQVTVE